MDDCLSWVIMESEWTSNSLEKFTDFSIRSAMGSYRPIQWVWLTWGYECFREQFEREMEHMRMLVDACFEQMHVDPPPRNDTINGLYLRRRIMRVVSLNTTGNDVF